MRKRSTGNEITFDTTFILKNTGKKAEVFRQDGRFVYCSRPLRLTPVARHKIFTPDMQYIDEARILNVNFC